uniref:Uncharacterized protein n=1 Tax=Siphoviridae sp. ctEJG5 TaxID=2827814 RepID=A0A8S5RXE7_9CAUD|nr:MAG TPA: hypothetical protein [Siphoviridae sp. ctEJG5]
MRKQSQKPRTTTTGGKTLVQHGKNHCHFCRIAV